VLRWSALAVPDESAMCQEHIARLKFIEYVIESQDRQSYSSVMCTAQRLLLKRDLLLSSLVSNFWLKLTYTTFPLSLSTTRRTLMLLNNKDLASLNTSSPSWPSSTLGASFTGPSEMQVMDAVLNR